MPRTGYFFATVVALIGVFAFSSGPAGADHVAGEEPYFSCKASLAHATLLDTANNALPKIEPFAANSNREECAEDTAGPPNVSLPPAPAPPFVFANAAQAVTEILCANDDPDPNVDPGDNDACDAGRRSFEQQVLARTDGADVNVTLAPPSPAIQLIVQGANTRARASCDPVTNTPVLESFSNVANVRVFVAGVEVPITLPPANQEAEIPILGLATLTLNERVGTEGAYPDNAPSGQVTRRAVHLEVPGGSEPTLGSVADVVVSESTADFHGDVCPEGKIVVKKETAPDENPNSTNFSFTSPGLTPASFQLQDDGTRTFDEVLPGGYAVTEGAPTNDYVLTAINCAENRSDNTTTSVPNRAAQVNVGPGETVTCTFINAKPPPGVCPTGSTPNQQGQCIINTVSCPAGSTLNQATGQCIINTTTCPPNSTRPDPNGPCVVTNITCPAGSTGPNPQGQCISNTITCPPGSTNQQGQCVNNTITCPAGTTGPNGQGQCVNNTLSCPPGSTQVGNQCVVARPDCPPGSSRNPQGQCVISSVQCPAGTAFNPTTLGCTSAPLGGTLVPINQIRGVFPASPCVGQGFGTLVGIVGTNGPDRITGTNLSDRIFALAGNDRVSGGRGDDCVEGGAGNDTIDGSNGNDVMLAASGNDSLNGGPGRDRLEAGSGRDGLSGGSGHDVMRGGGGRDRLNGGFGNDRLFGGPGNDGIHTGNGRDRVSAGSGNDIINAATRAPAAFVNCGPGKDRVRINKNERRRVRNCEFIDITTRIKGRGTPRRRR